MILFDILKHTFPKMLFIKHDMYEKQVYQGILQELESIIKVD